MQTGDTGILTILLADDDSDDRELFEDALKSVSMDLVLKMAENGIEVLNQLKQDHLPDLVFLDLNMPLKNGYECLKDIKNDVKLRHIPVVIFSTSLQQEAVNEVYDHGANLYIVKPNSFSDLKALLKKVLSLNWRAAVQTPKENFIFQV